MGDTKMTLGQAIDQIIEALSQLEPDARQTAIQAACSHSGVTLGEAGPQSSTETSSEPSGLVAPSPAKTETPAAGPQARDVRSLKEAKQPSSAVQMACIVAYYLQELAPAGERKGTIKTPDLETYFKQAGYRLPQTLDQVLLNAKASGYFESVSRGEYKLNTVGYNLVVHNLPKPEAS